ncbi:MAG: NAD-dependent epimerase/dehydratase family protein [Longimicrobiales bacterium]|nr:NAD-dependent epimerase/dehydratase family protein [Longimicrobiales bacterium]
MTSSLITGGCGFLGRHLTKLLLDAGSAVTLLDPAPCAEHFAPDVRHLRASVTDTAALEEAMEGAGRVFHMAGTPHLWAPRRSGAYALHLEGTRAVVDAAVRRGGVRVIHTSTEAILRDFTGSGGGGGLAPESHPDSEPWLPRARTLPPGYCRAKLASERLVLDAAREGHDVVIVSPASLLGPGDTSLTPPTRMLLGFLRGRFPAFLEGWLRIADVRDVASAHLEAAVRGVPGQRYVVGGPDQRMSAFLRDLEEVSGRPMPKVRVPSLLALATAHAAEFLANTITRRAPNATVAGVRLALAPAVPDLDAPPESSGMGRRPGFAPRALRMTLRDTVAWLENTGLIESPARRA